MKYEFFPYSVPHNMEPINLIDLTESQRIEILKKEYFKKTGKKLNLDNPLTFNEKIQWYKTFYRNPLLTKIVDKHAFKQYSCDVLGCDMTAKLLAVWNNLNDINFNKFPGKFVLKSNLQSDDVFVKIIQDKNSVSLDELKTELYDWLNPYNIKINSHCWAYRNAKPLIIAEEYLEESEGKRLTDYRMYCYGGVCKHFRICPNHSIGTKYINFDMSGNILKISDKTATDPINIPKELPHMVKIAEQLARPFPFVRVDFYLVNGRIYIGEMTFYPGSGYNTYAPEWDLKFGDWLDLNYKI